MAQLQRSVFKLRRLPACTFEGRRGQLNGKKHLNQCNETPSGEWTSSGGITKLLCE
uniref:Uncharacterized protein n=1 Tax=Eimeria tenella TaxID=5802 RepID=H9B915_EIMTE|nr:hypothetical protein [Eimeria tenella]